MKIKSILFTYNDLHRADFVLSNFTKHNPNIEIIIYNGGVNGDEIFSKYSSVSEVINGRNIWQKRTKPVCDIGSFDYDWFEIMFDKGLSLKDETHLLFLETDVLTQREITIPPDFDMSGPMNGAGPIPERLAYTFFGIDGYKFHTGSGGTIYSKNFFEKCKDNLFMIERAYKEIPHACYQDLLMSLLARYTGLSIGNWIESSNYWGGFYNMGNDNWVFSNSNCRNSTLVHGVKIDD